MRRRCMLKGRFRAAEGKLDEAKNLAAAALATDPSLPAGHFLMGKILSALGHPAEAIQSFQDVLKVQTTHVPSMLEIARLRLIQRDFGGAVESAQQALTAQPQSNVARLLLAQGLLGQGNRSGAELQLTTLLKTAPDSPEVHSTIADLHVSKGEFAKARSSYSHALALNAGSVNALRGLTMLDLRDHNVQSARARIDEHLSRTPDDPDLLLLASVVYSAAGDQKSAESALRRVVDRHPERSDAYDALVVLYVSQNRLDNARKMFDDAALREPKAVGPLTMSAVILLAQRHVDDAQKKFEQVIALDPRALVASNNLAWIYAEKNTNLDVALQLAQTAKAGMPNSPEVDDTLGWVYYKKGLSTLAISSLKRSVAATPDSPVFLGHLGLAYAQNGDKDKARETLERALKLKADFDGADEARKVLQSIGG